MADDKRQETESDRIASLKDKAEKGFAELMTTLGISRSEARALMAETEYNQILASAFHLLFCLEQFDDLEECKICFFILGAGILAEHALSTIEGKQYFKPTDDTIDILAKSLISIKVLVDTAEQLFRELGIEIVRSEEEEEEEQIEH